jgi:hypothetical protein
LSPHLARAGQWFLRSGIQEPNGGVARYYRTDLQSNYPISTEITGYSISALVYLHTLTRDERWLQAALRAARFLTRQAWDAGSRSMPFEVDPPVWAYFFDSGIVVRALLAVWRATGEQEFLDVAASLGESMAADFACEDGSLHPVISLPGKIPAPRDTFRWSASPGCYQLKAAMAWWDLAEATGEERFREPYQRVLERALRTCNAFLPGHSDRLTVMDRLHAFAYFLEGLLPRGAEARCAAALAEGIRRMTQLLREIAPRFGRADVYAQLLRIRLYADWAGAAPLDREAAQIEADTLAGFQAASSDPRIDGGYYFGRKGGAWLPYVNPVSTAFALQALGLWEHCRSGGAQPHRHLLI